MKDYSAMRDDEIAMEIFLLNLCEPARKLAISRGMNHHDILRGGGEWSKYDPCNNPADAWPIIVENNISLHAPRFNEGWMAEFTGSDEDVNDGFDVDYFEYHNANPLRAAMIVYLKMKDK